MTRKSDAVWLVFPLGMASLAVFLIVNGSIELMWFLIPLAILTPFGVLIAVLLFTMENPPSLIADDKEWLLDKMMRLQETRDKLTENPKRR